MQMFRAKCARCEWTFDTVTLPMRMDAAGDAIKQACCPMCANRGGNTVADPRPLSPAEAEHKARVIREQIA